MAAALSNLVLNASEFSARALGARPAVAVFDCDGTLWSRDAGVLFLHWSIEQGLVSRSTADWILERHSHYRQGSIGEAEICGDMTRMYAGLREEELRASAGRFYREHIAAHVFPVLRDLLRELTAQGSEIWTVSSTNAWVIEEAMRDFGIPAERILAGRAIIRAGVTTDELMMMPTGEGKREALLARGIARPDAVFGNSVHDAAMLRIARMPFAVNPSAELARIAGEEGWPVFYPAAPTK